MDVGGGSGELIAAVKEYPGLRGTVFDLPRCAETANNYLQSVSVSDQVSFLASDFFNTIPAIADVIILKSMIHDWNDGGGFGGGGGFHGGGGGFQSSASFQGAGLGGGGFRGGGFHEGFASGGFLGGGFHRGGFHRRALVGVGFGSYGYYDGYYPYAYNDDYYYDDGGCYVVVTASIHATVGDFDESKFAVEQSLTSSDRGGSVSNERLSSVCIMGIRTGRPTISL
jgi:hypothetical protein